MDNIDLTKFCIRTDLAFEAIDINELTKEQGVRMADTKNVTYNILSGSEPTKKIIRIDCSNLLNLKIKKSLGIDTNTKKKHAY